MSALSLDSFVASLQRLESFVKSRSPGGRCFAFVNHGGDIICIAASVKDSPTIAGTGWARSHHSIGKIDEIPQLITDTHTWIAELPSRDQRDVEKMLKLLAELCEHIPTLSGSAEMAVIWDNCRNVLQAQSKALAHNILPKPDNLSAGE